MSNDIFFFGLLDLLLSLSRGFSISDSLLIDKLRAAASPPLPPPRGGTGEGFEGMASSTLTDYLKGLTIMGSPSGMFMPLYLR